MNISNMLLTISPSMIVGILLAAFVQVAVAQDTNEIDKLQQKKQQIVSDMESKGRVVQQLITQGMTEAEVKSLVGDPRAKTQGYHAGPYSENGAGDYYFDSWNYGTHWVIFKNGLVICVSSSERNCD
jgi:hypothetical protein